MNASTRERFTQPRDGIFVVKLRDAGGPGSGNFGHAGRPGKVGGSAAEGDGEKSEDTKQEAKQRGKAAEAFHSHFKSKGYKVAHVDELPAYIAKILKIREADTDLPPEALSGIEAALNDIKTGSPALHAAVLDTTFVYGHRKDPNVSATFGQTKEGNYFVINANEDAVADTYNPVDPTFTVGAKHFAGDPEQVYRAVMLHEIGHLADAMTGDNITGALITTLAQRMPIDDIPDYFRRKVSEYAMHGGPKEAAAEVFASTVLELPLPTELHGFRDDLKALLKRAAPPKDRRLT